MKIADISIRNFKKIKLAALTLRDWNEVVGANASGKSSLVDAVIAALKWTGISNFTVQPVTEGERNGEVTVTLDGDMQYTVKRTFLKSGKTTLEVKVVGDDTPMPSPQTLLDSMTGGAIIDPGRFVLLKPKDQVEELLDACGLKAKLDDIEASRAIAYAQRTNVGRDRDRAKKAMEALGTVEKADKVDVTEVSKQRDALREQQDEYVELAGECDDLRRVVERLKRELVIAERSLKAKEDELAGMDLPDTSELDAQLASATEINNKAERWSQYQTHNTEYQQMVEEYESLTRKINDYDDAKKDLLEGIDLGIPNLSYTTDGIELNGIPLGQCSRSEQLRVGVEIAAKKLPEDGIRFIAIKEFAFDQATKDSLRQRFADKGIQFVIEDDQTETVSGDGVMVITVDDGEVKERK